MVSNEVSATASSAQGAHQGQDNDFASSGFAIGKKPCRNPPARSSEKANLYNSR